MERWTNLGGEDQGRDRMGAGCSKETYNDMVGALPRDEEAEELKRPPSKSQRQCQGLWGQW